MPAFKLGKGSLNELRAVHEDLLAVVTRALELSVQDFAVHDGIRSLGEQEKLVQAGVSQTLDSRHLTGHAVDLVPYVNGKLRWEWEPIFRIADAVRIAAKELGVPLRWGGVWDVAFTESAESPEDLMVGYTVRRRKAGRKAFPDGPHFELPRKDYPIP